VRVAGDADGLPRGEFAVHANEELFAFQAELAKFDLGLRPGDGIAELLLDGLDALLEFDDGALKVELVVRCHGLEVYGGG
jgi:hypothetical protein